MLPNANRLDLATFVNENLLNTPENLEQAKSLEYTENLQKAKKLKKAKIFKQSKKPKQFKNLRLDKDLELQQAKNKSEVAPSMCRLVSASYTKQIDQYQGESMVFSHGGMEYVPKTSKRGCDIIHERYLRSITPIRRHFPCQISSYKFSCQGVSYTVAHNCHIKTKCSQQITNRSQQIPNY